MRTAKSVAALAMTLLVVPASGCAVMNSAGGPKAAGSPSTSASAAATPAPAPSTQALPSETPSANQSSPAAADVSTALGILRRANSEYASATSVKIEAASPDKTTSLCEGAIKGGAFRTVITRPNGNYKEDIFIDRDMYTRFKVNGKLDRQWVWGTQGSDRAQHEAVEVLGQFAFSAAEASLQSGVTEATVDGTPVDVLTFVEGPRTFTVSIDRGTGRFLELRNGESTVKVSNWNAAVDLTAPKPADISNYKVTKDSRDRESPGLSG